jgi:hypothetical protein
MVLGIKARQQNTTADESEIILTRLAKMLDEFDRLALNR